MKKFNLSKVLSEFIAVSTIAVNIANSGTIIGGNIYLGETASSNQSQSQTQISMSSVTIENDFYSCNNSSNWTLSQSFVVNYPAGNVCYYYYSCTAGVYPRYYTLPTNIHEVSITVIPFNSDTGIIANFSGSVLAGQTLTLYVAPLYKGMYNALYNALYDLARYGGTPVPQWGIYPPYIEYGDTIYGFQPYSETHPVNSTYTYFMPFYQSSNSTNSSCTWSYFDYTSYNSDSNIQGITVELSNGNILIGSDTNGNYYVSSLASSSTMFNDGGSTIMILDPSAEYNTAPAYSSLLSDGYYFLSPIVPHYVPVQSQTTIPLPPFWQASCITPYKNGHCYAKVPYRFEHDFSTEVIINYY